MILYKLFIWAYLLILGLRLENHGCAALQTHSIQITSSNDSEETLVAQTFPFVINHVSIATMDIHNEAIIQSFYTLRIQVDIGSIFNMTSVHGLWVRQFQNGVENLLSGTIENINQFLDDGKVQFNPPVFDYEGGAIVMFDLIEGLMENEKGTENLHIIHKTELTIQVRPLYVLNVMISPSTAVIWEDEKMSFAVYPINITFSGLPSKANSLECAVTSDRGHVDKHLLLGAGANVTSQFSQITYTPFDGYNGIDYVHVHCHERQLGQRFGSALSVVIKAIDNKPVIVAPTKFFSVAEDDNIQLGHVLGVFVVDTDAHEYSQSAVIVTLTIITEPRTSYNFEFPPDQFIAGVYKFTDHLNSTIAMIGSVNHVNHALELLMISLPMNWFGQGQITISCDQYIPSNILPTKVQSMPEAHVEHVHFEILSVNDAPQLSVKNAKLFIIEEDSFVSLEHSAISVFDVDESDTDQYHLRINIRSYKGTAIGSFHFPTEISDFVSLEYVKDPYCATEEGLTTTLGLNGSVAEISRALNQVYWIPREHWHGAIHDGVCLSVSDDQGRFALRTLILQVVSLPDRPHFELLRYNISLKEDIALAIGPSLNMSVIDPDSDQFPFSLSLAYELTVQSVHGGALSLSEFVPGSYLVDGGKGDSSFMRIKGNLDVINHALNAMTYIPPKDMDTDDLLKFYIIDDEGFSDSADVKVVFEAINDAPRIIASNPIYLYQDDGAISLHFKRFELFDVDGRRDDEVELLVVCSSDHVDSVQINVGTNEKIRLSNTTNFELIILGPMDSVTDVVISNNIQVFFKSTSVLVKYWTLKLQVRDRYGAFTEEEFSLPLPQRWNIIPAIIQSTEPLKAHEDIPVKIGTQISLQGLQKSDTLHEVSLVTRSTIIPDIFKLSIALNYDRKCFDEGQLEMVISDQSTRRLYMNASEDEFKKSIEEISTISGAIVIRHPNDHFNSLSLTIKLLSFEEVKIDVVYIHTDAVYEYKCYPKSSVQRGQITGWQNEFAETWGLPPIVEEGGGLTFSDRQFGGIYFVDCNCDGVSRSIVMRGEVTDLNDALADIYYVPPSNFFGRARIDVQVNTVLNTYGKALSSDSASAILFIDIEEEDDPPSIHWKGVNFIDYTVVIESTVNEPVLFGRNLTLFDVDTSWDDISCAIKVSAGQICHQMREQVHSDAKAEFTDIYCNKSQSMRSGDLLAVNEWLNTLVYVPDSMWTGIDEIEIRVNAKSYELKSVIAVHVSGTLPYPFRVILDPNRTIEGIEDTPLKFEGLMISYNQQLVNHIASLQQEDLIIEAAISVGGGMLRFENDNLCVIHHLNASSLRVKGYVEMVNESLKTLIYMPSSDHFGSETMTIELFDGSSKYNELVIRLFIKSVRDPPTIIFPPSHYGYIFKVYEDTVSTIGRNLYNDASGRCSEKCWESPKANTCCPIRIEDKDGEDEDILRLEMRAENGAVRLPRLSAHDYDSSKTATIESTFKEYMEVNGTLGKLNELLNGALFIGKRDFTSRDHKLARLHITVIDNANTSSNLTLFFQVIPVNDRPSISTNMSCMPADSREYGRDIIDYIVPMICAKVAAPEDTRITLPAFAVTDVDITNFNDIVQVTLTAQNGELSLKNHRNIHEWVLGTSSRPSKIYTIRGSIHGINEALSGISYLPDLNYHGADQIKIVVSDMENFGIDVMTGSSVNLSTSIIVPITVTPVIDSPIIHVKSQINTTEGTQVRVHSSIFHGDSDEAEIEVHIHCSHGRIRMISTRGITDMIEESDRTDLYMISGKGTVQAWNDVLQDLLYIPKVHWNSFNNYWDRIRWNVFNVDDPFRGTENWQETFVQVEAVNDAPEWIVPGRHMVLQATGGYKIDSVEPMMIDEDERLYIKPISIHDPDTLDDEGEFNRIQDFLIQVEISASFGSLTLLKREGLFFQHGNDGTTNMNFRCSIAHCNRALHEIKYQPFENFHGRDVIRFHVRDEGNIGSGGEKMSNVTIPIIVKSVVDIPSIVSPFIVYCAQEKPCSIIPNVSIIDPDENIQLWMEITATNGIISFPRTAVLSNMNDVSSPHNMHDDDSSWRSDYAKWTGNASTLNAMLQQMIYTPNKGSQYFGRLEHLHIVLRSLPHDGDDDSMPWTSTKDINIVVTTTDDYETSEDNSL